MTSKDKTASFCWQPCKSGDGYSWGGGYFVRIGERLLFVGEDEIAAALAKEIARRWNEAPEEVNDE